MNAHRASVNPEQAEAVERKPDRRDRLLAALEKLLSADDWRGAGCQAAILQAVGVLWPHMAGRRRRYLMDNIDLLTGELTPPDMNYRDWCRDQDFTCAILMLLGAEDLPKEHRQFVRDMAKRMKWADFKPSDKQMNFAASLANQWGVSGGEVIEKDEKAEAALLEGGPKSADGSDDGGADEEMDTTGREHNPEGSPKG